MATGTREGGNGLLYFIAGALLVAVVMGILFYNGGLHIGRSPTERAIDRTADAVGDAVDRIGDQAQKSSPQPKPPT